MSLRLGFFGVLLAAATAAGCSGVPRGGEADLRTRLARVGLELIGEGEAQLPPAERGRYLACRVIPGSIAPALPDDPAGYLIIGIKGEPPSTREAILGRLEALAPGEVIELVVRRNPHLQSEAGWWEADVKLRLP